MENKDLLTTYAESKQNMCIENDTISDGLFQEYGVNRGLRDVNGKGVLTGLTRISKIVSFMRTEIRFPVTENCGTEAIMSRH